MNLELQQQHAAARARKAMFYSSRPPIATPQRSRFIEVKPFDPAVFKPHLLPPPKQHDSHVKRYQWALAIGACATAVGIADVQQAAAFVSGVSVADLCGQSRQSRHVLPRQVAMLVARQVTARSYPEIGRRFGGRDHTTVLHACTSITRKIATDAKVADLVRGVREVLGLQSEAEAR